MKVGVLEIAPELAAEAFAMLRDEGAVVLGTLDASPALRIVLTHPALPDECERAAGEPPVPVRLAVRVDEAKRVRLDRFYIDPWSARRK
jgi:hypothetical protein